MKKVEVPSILTLSEIIEFQELALKHLGIKLSPKEANDQGSRIITLIELIIKNRLSTKDDKIT